MRVFPSADEEQIARALAQAGIAVEPRALTLERHDWRWLVRLPDERMLLVPVDELGAQRLTRERRLLAVIAPRLSFAVTVPLGALDGPLDVRRRVAGETGLHLHWSTLEDPARAELYADDLARVLSELHTVLTTDEARALAGDPPVAGYPLAAEPLRTVIGSLPAEIHALVHAAIDRYQALGIDEADLVLVHGDVGTHNLVFDPSSRRVVGLLDFEGFARLDRHRDLHYLPSYGPRVLERVLEGYRARTGVILSVERIRLLHLATALSFWAWREEDPEAHDRLSSRNRDQALAWVGMAVFGLE